MLNMGMYFFAPRGFMERFRKNKLSPLLDPTLDIEGTPSQIVRERVRRVLGRSVYHDGSLGIAIGWTYENQEERERVERAFMDAGPQISEQIRQLGASLEDNPTKGKDEESEQLKANVTAVPPLIPPTQ